MEPNSTQEETQVHKELQQSICQHTGEISQATTTAERNNSVSVEEEATAPTATN